MLCSLTEIKSSTVTVIAPDPKRLRLSFLSCLRSATYLCCLLECRLLEVHGVQQAVHVRLLQQVYCNVRQIPVQCSRTRDSLSISNQRTSQVSQLQQPSGLWASDGHSINEHTPLRQLGVLLGLLDWNTIAVHA